MTRFLCQELLFEYATGALDRSRHHDVEEYLETCRDSQRELESLRKGLVYARAMSTIQVSDSLREALLNFEPQWKKRLRAWHIWSSNTAWKAIPFLFIFSAFGLGLYLTKPWQKSANNEVVLLDQPRSQSPEPSSPTPAPEPAPAPAPTPSAPSTEPPVLNSSAPPVPQAEPPLAGSGSGLLIREELTTGDFSTASPEIKSKILALNGKSAGSVELGWLRRPTESYFHISLPESKYGEFYEFLKTFGPVQIHKQRHPRVMPEGQIRIILTVKGKGGTDHENEADAP